MTGKDNGLPSRRNLIDAISRVRPLFVRAADLPDRIGGQSVPPQLAC